MPKRKPSRTPLPTTFLLLGAVALLAACQRTATQDATSEIVIASGPCYHDGLSEWTCPDSTAQREFEALLGDAASVSVSVTTRDGRRHTVQLPGNTDAVFLNRSAVENFLLRYYDATDRQKAARLRQHVGTPPRQ